MTISGRLFLTTLFFACLSGGAAAQGIRCGEQYSVARGDTLSIISQAAYGTGANYQLIYSANADVIGPDPAIIEVDTQLVIPCLDVSIASPAALPVPVDPPERNETLASVDRTIRVVSASDWSPFLDRDLQSGGMIAELVSVALNEVVGPDGYRIDFVNDWAAQVDPLLTRGAYDVAIGWQRPDCDSLATLGADSRALCEAVAWSDPIYEQVVSFYTRTDAPAPGTHADLLEGVLCRPEAYPSAALDQVDLTERTMTLALVRTPGDCIEGLLDGSYDAAALATEVAEAEIAQQDAEAQIVRHGALDSRTTLHAIVAADNPDAPALLSVMNAGLTRLKDSGTWFRLVRRNLADHRSRL